MSLLITLDVGTSNSRAVLWRNTEVLSRVRAPVGARDTVMTGGKESLSRGVSGCLAGVCLKAGISPDAVDVTVASGMITSDLGLIEVPHLVAPVGLEDFANGMISEKFPSIWKKPLWFVPGVKNSEGKVEPDNLPQMDMMRGAEVECVALKDRLNLSEPCWLVLPGSLTRFVRLGKNGRIVQIISALAGEMMVALSHHSILAASVDATVYLSPKWLVKGYKASVSQGLSRAAYCVRLAELWSESTASERTAYLLGALLAADIQALKANALKTNISGANVSGQGTIYVAGREELRDAFVTLLNFDGAFSNVHSVDSNMLEDLAGWGALLVARSRGLITE